MLTPIFHSQKNVDIKSAHSENVNEEISSCGENLETIKLLIQSNDSFEVCRKIHEKRKNEIRGKCKTNINQQQIFEKFVNYRETNFRREYYWNKISDCQWYRVKNNQNNNNKGFKLQHKHYTNNCKLFPTLSESHSINLRKLQEFQIISKVGKSKSCDSMNDLKNVCPFKSTIKVGLPGFRKNS